MTLIFILTALFAIVGLALHAKRLPPQNLVAIALLIYMSASAVEWSAHAFGMPFTPLRLKETSFWCLPLGWIGALLFSRKIAQAILNSLRGNANYGLWILTLTVLMTTTLWALLEVALAELNLLNLIGRLFSSVAMLLVIFPWLIEKRPRISS